ncbi:MAG: DUF835 domain-containing protein [Candidatus Saliniplasma sp.]
MEEDEENSEKTYKILLVDDDEDILNLLKITLEKAERFDSKLTVAKNGIEAQKEMERTRFDLVIADQKMPGISGTELLKDVKEMYPDTARILITGFSALDVAKEAINKAKVDSYIEKPWDNDELRDIVYNLLTGIDSDSKEVELSDDFHADKGSVYLFEDRTPDRAVKVATKKLEEDMEGLFVSRIEPDKFRKRYGLEDKDIHQYWLTRVPGRGNLEPANLELLADRITRYLEKHSGVVLLEGIESLTRENSFERVVGFFENLVDVASMENGILLVTIDPRTLGDQKLAIIERNMNVV